MVWGFPKAKQDILYILNVQTIVYCKYKMAKPCIGQMTNLSDQEEEQENYIRLSPTFNGSIFVLDI